MKNFSLFPVLFLLVVACSNPPQNPEGGWTTLFDGKSLDGWKAMENPASFRVENGELICDGPRAHLFYMGEAGNASFQNFELELEVKTEPAANSGVFFHTAFQEEAGWPNAGMEVQVNNNHRGGEGYIERKKTGSLYGIRNQYKAPAKDGEWFGMRIRVEANRVRVWVDGQLVTDYVEPHLPDGMEWPVNRLSEGTVAIQCHDPESLVRYRNIRLQPLPDDIRPTEAPKPDSLFVQVLELGKANFPLIDFHVHLKGGLTLEDVMAQSRQVGIQYGIAPNCGKGFPITDDAGIYAWVDSMRGYPVFLGMQAEGREWVDTFSPEAIAQFDYVFSDAMTFTDKEGRRTRLWKKEEVFIDDPQDFMEMYVEKIVGVLKNEPIDIYVNPTFLPEVIRADYDALWTDERMDKVINAAKANGIAIEINDRYRIPSEAFLRRAKEAGVKFSFGTNNTGPEDLVRQAYCLEMVEALGLTGQDMFLPQSLREKVNPQ